MDWLPSGIAIHALRQNRTYVVSRCGQSFREFVAGSVGGRHPNEPGQIQVGARAHLPPTRRPLEAPDTRRANMAYLSHD